MKENEMNIEDIKKEVLNRIKAVQKYKRIPEKKINKWIDRIHISEFNPRIITEDKGEVDKDILFNRKISDVIAFLSQYKDYNLEERWSGYENNYFMFSIERSETSDEIIERIYDIVDSDCRAFLKQEDEIADIDEQIRRLEYKKNKIVRCRNNTINDEE